MPARLSPDSSRVALITALLEQGVPLEEVQHLAGHADLRTTRLYDRRQHKVKRNIVERISMRTMLQQPKVVTRKSTLLDDKEWPMASNPIYLEIVDFFASGTTPQAVADFQPSPAAQERALELLELAKQDKLTPEQESELEHFTELEHILRMAKARARQILAAQQ